MKPVVLTIMDGVGIAKPNNGNAYYLAKKPNLERLFSEYSYTTINASANSVGLPEGQMGNSEVGHTNIGAGRVVYQQLELINMSIKNKTIAQKESFKELINFAKANNKVVHLMGLLSDGGVHSHINHIETIIEILDKEGIKVNVHAFYDGRDVSPKSALTFVERIEKQAKVLNNGHIVTGGGRYYGMDRDNNFSRTQVAYDAIINAKGQHTSCARKGVESSYENDVTDEFIVPYVVDGYSGVNDGDAFLFANFRPDRAIQISNAIIDESFNEFERKEFTNIYYSTMTRYTRVDSKVLFENEKIVDGLGEYLSSKNKKQLRIAETEKYAHVTFFFDGGEEKDYPGMKKVLINSPKVATYDMQPEMSANEVTDKLLEELDNDYDVVVLNFANPDMVGHTGNIDATIKAVETVDYNVGRIYDKVSKLGGVMLITADHGNSEMLLDGESNIVTAHTTNKVPFCITKKNLKLKEEMSLCDIAPTILDLLKIEKPALMTGNTIIMEEK